MKKTILSFLMLVSLLVLLILSTNAQQQRLGIRPQEIILDDANPSKPIEAYCFDRHVNINKGEFNYKYLQSDDSAITVKANGKTYSYSEAIGSIIEVVGRTRNKTNDPADLVIEIKKLISGQVTINVGKTAVFRDAEGTYDNQKALEVLNSADTKTYRDNIQNAIWAADVDRSRLESLGYKSKDEFLEKNRLSKENTSEEQISVLLEKEETTLIKDFEDIYLMDIFHLSRKTVKSVSDNIERLQNIYGVKVTGKFGPDVAKLLQRYKQEYLPELDELKIYSNKSQSFVFKAKSVIGDNKAYTFYTPLGAFRENDTETLKYVITLLSFIRGGVGKEKNMILELPSKQKEAGFKTTLNNDSITYLKGDSEVIENYFSGGNVTKFVSESPIKRTKDGYNKTLTYETEDLPTNQKMTVSARLKLTVMNFVRSFKLSCEDVILNRKRNVSSIASEARKASGSVTLGFEVGKIEIIKLFPENPFEINAE